MKGQVMTEDLLNYAEDVSNQLDGLAGANVSKLIDSHRALSSQLAEKDKTIKELQKALEDIESYPPFEETNNGDRFYGQMQDIAREALKGAPQ